MTTRKRADQWAKVIAEADEVAPRMRELYLQTGRFPGFVRRPLQRLLRWFMRLPKMTRHAARQDMQEDRS